MSLLTSVYAWKWDGATSTEVRAPENNLTNEMASRRPAYWYRGIVEIIEHAAQCKIMYMTQAYGPPPTPVPASDGTLPSALKQLDAAQTYLLACLDSCTDEQLGRPVPTKWHGETAANLFWVLAQHDACHGSQIDMLREEFEKQDRA